MTYFSRGTEKAWAADASVAAQALPAESVAAAIRAQVDQLTPTFDNNREGDLMLDSLRGTMSGRELEHADPDGAEWYEREVPPPAPPVVLWEGTMQSPAAWRAEIEADVERESAERAERDRERARRWWGRR